METLTTLKSKKSIRYTPEQRAEAIAYVKDFNTKNKRGGQKAAAEKFGITQITLCNWMKEERRALRRKQVLDRPRSKMLSSDEYAKLYARLAEVYSQISVLETEYHRLETLKEEAKDLVKQLS